MITLRIMKKFKALSHSFFAIALLFSTLSASLCHASERRFEIPAELRNRLDELARDRKIISSSTRDGSLFIADASAVLYGNAEKILKKAAEYDRFVEMDMPHLDISKVVDRAGPDQIYVFSKLSYLMLKSSQYMEVRLTPGVGVDWEMTPQRPNWEWSASSLFRVSEGSFYAEDLPGGKVFVRYFMKNDLDIPLSGLLGGFIRSELESGAADVIKILAREAGFQQ